MNRWSLFVPGSKRHGLRMKLGFENLYSIAVALYRGIRHSTDTHTDAQSAKKDVISTKPQKGSELATDQFHVVGVVCEKGRVL